MESNAEVAPVAARPAGRPVRKDEIVLEERGLYVESWLPERRAGRPFPTTRLPWRSANPTRIHVSPD